jgi:hypothetical protein
MRRPQGSKGESKGENREVPRGTKRNTLVFHFVPKTLYS